VRGRRGAALVTLIALTAVAGSTVTPGATGGTPATASSFGVEILLPGSQPIVAGALQGPPSAKSPAPSAYAYPADGSAVSVGSMSGNAAVNGRRPVAVAGSDLSGLNLFGGEITADAIALRSNASALRGVASGGFDGTSFTNLVVLGQTISPTPNQVITLGDWGHAYVLEQGSSNGTTLGVASFRGAVTGLDIMLSADHGGLPAGSRILIGHAATFARLSLAASKVAPKATAKQAKTPTPSSNAQGGAIPKEPDRTGGPITSNYPLPGSEVQPHLTPDRYVFPVYGPVAYGDSFGAPRADTIWHHGDDIFAPLGAPVLAVTDGTVYSIGWEKVGGNRLWLRDGQGNEFYYAHLSAYSPLAVNGTSVRAGDVLGFVGNTGDAEGTPYHLHFEIHPVGMLFLGYDGVVDPTPFLDAWRRLKDIRFPSGAAWAPAIAPRSNAPLPGVILIESSDISSASGLDPKSLERVMAPVSAGTGEEPATVAGPAGRH
jgi:murein DD-endopeptidase MepM/ murein hydrolase activator NlpD